VERRPLSGEAVASGEYGGADYAGSEQPFTGGSETISIPVMEEQVEVRKVARPVEEVVVTKDATQETRRVSETVRREEFDIQGDEGLTERSGEEVLGRPHR
jgi:uncharacterized protein (TIGR02271 family)